MSSDVKTSYFLRYSRTSRTLALPLPGCPMPVFSRVLSVMSVKPQVSWGAQWGQGPECPHTTHFAHLQPLKDGHKINEHKFIFLFNYLITSNVESDNVPKKADNVI